MGNHVRSFFVLKPDAAATLFLDPMLFVSFSQLSNQQSSPILYSAREQCHIKSKSD
jgi:hypothetical protein